MKLLRTDWYGSFTQVRYHSVSKEEYDSIMDCTEHQEPFNLSCRYHNYDGFVEKSASGISGGWHKVKKPWPELTDFFILDAKTV